MAEEIQYSSKILNEIIELFALKDSTLPNYQKGADLVALFNSLGYNDVYTYENGIGISTPDIGSCLTRTFYAKRRLEDLNNKFKVPLAIQELISRSKQPEILTASFKEILSTNDSKGYSPQLMKTSEYTAKLTPVPSAEEKQNLSRKQLEDKILGVIPESCPVVFISYSWDGDSHKDWVGQLADDLTKMGAYVLFDQYLDPGTSISNFMELGIERADKVVIIGTESYKQKSLGISGGAAVEGLILRNGVMANIGTTKIIPCLRQGSFASSFPSSISDRKGEDFTDDSQYRKTLSSLWSDINNKPTRKRPVIGQTQSYPVPVPTSVAEAAKTDFRRDNDMKWLNILLSNFSFRLMQGYIESGPYFEPAKLCDAYDTWNYIKNKVTFVIYDKELELRINAFYNLWSDLINIGVRYYEPIKSDMTRFRFSGIQVDLFISSEAELDFYKMVATMQKMREPLKNLASYVMDHYEIDVESLSRTFELRK